MKKKMIKYVEYFVYPESAWGYKDFLCGRGLGLL